jgi:hypothetical protein
MKKVIKINFQSWKHETDVYFDVATQTRGCIQKFPDWVDNEINNNNNNNNNNNKYSLRSNTKGHGGKTHKTDSQNSDTTEPSGKELYRLQFLLRAASPETFGFNIVYWRVLSTCLPEPFQIL